MFKAKINTLSFKMFVFLMQKMNFKSVLILFKINFGMKKELITHMINR